LLPPCSQFAFGLLLETKNALACTHQNLHEKAGLAKIVKIVKDNTYKKRQNLRPLRRKQNCQLANIGKTQHQITTAIL
jgi:hypothetical protein